jgi:hypothetical protein
VRRPGRRRDRPAAAHLAQDPRFEDVLRDALQDAAKSVEPTGDGLERIRRRLGEPWLARQVSLMLTADWLRLALATAGAVIIAVAGAVAFGQIYHGDTGISLSTGTSAHAPTGIGFSSSSNGQFPALNAARATSAHTSSARPIPSQPLLGGAHSAQVKPSLPEIAAAAPVPDREQPSAAAAGCPPSPSGTPTGTPTPTPTPTVTPTPTANPTPSPEPVGTLSPAASSSLSPSGARSSVSRTPAVGSQSKPCDDGRGRR